jgi:hypothetical protein
MKRAAPARRPGALALVAALGLAAVYLAPRRAADSRRALALAVPPPPAAPPTAAASPTAAAPPAGGECAAPRAAPAESARVTAHPRLTLVPGGPERGAAPEAPDAELDPLDVEAARFAEALRGDFPGLGRPAPTAAHERDAVHYSPSMHARLNLLGDLGRVQTASLSLFDRVGASDETRDEHERVLRAFASTALAPDFADAVLAFVRDECPAGGEGVRTTARRWEHGGRSLNAACHEHYGSVEVVAAGASVL